MDCNSNIWKFEHQHTDFLIADCYIEVACHICNIDYQWLFTKAYSQNDGFSGLKSLKQRVSRICSNDSGAVRETEIAGWKIFFEQQSLSEQMVFAAVDWTADMLSVLVFCVKLWCCSRWEIVPLKCSHLISRVRRLSCWTTPCGAKWTSHHVIHAQYFHQTGCIVDNEDKSRISRKSLLDLPPKCSSF